MTEREFATNVVRRLQEAKFQALWAGGCVRDKLLGLSPNDYDVATDARPEQVQEIFRHCVAVGANFGVIEVIGPRGENGEFLTVEIATFRTDGPYQGGRWPEWVNYSTPEHDAQRRDFTINGMFFDPITNTLHDYVGGQTDLAAKVLRAIGNPAARFAEDKLRVLRGVRIAARFRLHVEPETLAAARAMAPEIRIVSAERIAEEFRKLLAHSNRFTRCRGISLLREFDLVEPLLPELLPDEIWDRTLGVIAQFQNDEPVSFPLAFAALLQFLGKATAEKIALRLKLSNTEKDRLVWLVDKREYLLDAPTMRLSKLKPILVHPGIGELITLHRTNAWANNSGLEHVEFCEKMLRESTPEELNPEPLVTGDDLIAMGMKPGPEFKRLLQEVRDAQLEGRIKNREEAIQFVR
jgi:poly(A) polymerase